MSAVSIAHNQVLVRIVARSINDNMASNTLKRQSRFFTLSKPDSSVVSE